MSMKNNESIIMNETIDISIVCPFFNEEQMVSLFMDKIFNILGNLHRSFEIVCINDGSSDNTLKKLIDEQKKRKNIKIITLSRNFGKESALTAGLDLSIGEAIIPIDADLQDPPEIIYEFIDYWDQGYDVVLGKRVDRSTDSLPKSFTANLYYKVHNIVSSVKTPENVGDFRLITKKVKLAIQKMPENQRFMKGIFAWVGFKTAVVEYKRSLRQAGKTKFNGWKLWNFALDGLTSFSTVPLKLCFYFGLSISFFTFLYGTYTILKTLILGIDVPGYASLITVILFMGGLQMIGIGILGEYIGRIYMESKRRPIYIIDEILV